MDYKTILVHCNDTARLPRLLEPAVRLGALFEAHVIGLSVTPPVRVHHRWHAGSARHHCSR